MTSKGLKVGADRSLFEGRRVGGFDLGLAVKFNEVFLFYLIKFNECFKGQKKYFVFHVSQSDFRFKH